MPLIKKPEKSQEKEQVRIRISREVLEDIETYCQWQDLPSKDYFFEQAMREFFKKDKDWKNYKKQLKKNPQQIQD